MPRACDSSDRKAPKPLWWPVCRADSRSLRTIYSARTKRFSDHLCTLRISQALLASSLFSMHKMLFMPLTVSRYCIQVDALTIIERTHDIVQRAHDYQIQSRYENGTWEPNTMESINCRHTRALKCDYYFPAHLHRHNVECRECGRFLLELTPFGRYVHGRHQIGHKTTQKRTENSFEKFGWTRGRNTYADVQWKRWVCAEKRQKTNQHCEINLCHSITVSITAAELPFVATCCSHPNAQHEHRRPRNWWAFAFRTEQTLLPDNTAA